MVCVCVLAHLFIQVNIVSTSFPVTPLLSILKKLISGNCPSLIQLHWITSPKILLSAFLVLRFTCMCQKACLLYGYWGSNADSNAAETFLSELSPRPIVTFSVLCLCNSLLFTCKWECEWKGQHSHVMAHI